jgi:hypothetical protein
MWVGFCWGFGGLLCVGFMFIYPQFSPQLLKDILIINDLQQISSRCVCVFGVFGTWGVRPWGAGRCYV